MSTVGLSMRTTLHLSYEWRGLPQKTEEGKPPETTSVVTEAAVGGAAEVARVATAKTVREGARPNAVNVAELVGKEAPAEKREPAWSMARRRRRNTVTAPVKKTVTMPAATAAARGLARGLERMVAVHSYRRLGADPCALATMITGRKRSTPLTKEAANAVGTTTATTTSDATTRNTAKVAGTRTLAVNARGVTLAGGGRVAAENKAAARVAVATEGERKGAGVAVNNTTEAIKSRQARSVALRQLRF
mmetsp:Transcript_45294/g.91381  ORF Transcript_45294/g.91381 Transcript_45294/m.91381 type:complete len:248 (-) Transcript_45294:147-890(-)